MAYIDFKRNGETFRCILGTAITVARSFNDSNKNNIWYNSSTTRIQSTGSELLDLFRLRNVDWDQAPDTVYYNGTRKGYAFIADNELCISFMKRPYAPNSANININGSVQSGSTLLTPNYTYEGTMILITVGFRNANTARILQNNIWSNNENINIQLPNAPSFGTTTTQNFTGNIYLAMSPITYNGKQYYAYNLCDLNTYKPNKIIFGTSANIDTKSNETKAYLSGCVLKKAGMPVMKTIEDSGWISYENNKYSNFATNQEIVKGNGLNVTNTIIFMFFYNTWYFDSINDFIPDNTDIPEYPDQPQNPDYPDDEPDGGDGNGDKSSDDIPDSDTVTPYKPTGLLSVYKLSNNQLDTLGKELWSENFMNTILKITQNAIDAVIELKCMYVNFTSNKSVNIKLGNYNSDIVTTQITDYVQSIDFGTLDIDRFFGDFKDYNPWTKISIYLPFIGIKDLSVNEIMNGTIELKYNVDVLTGDCVALITVNNTIEGTDLSSVLYQFDGNMDIQIPISQASANTIISARLSQFQQVSNAILRIAGGKDMNGYKKANIGINAGVNVMQNEINANHLDITRVGNIGGAKGMLSIKTPYLIVERVIPNYPTSYAKNLGVPTDRTIPFNSIKGFTQVTQVFISNFTGTQREYEELIALLQTGIVF